MSGISTPSQHAIVIFSDCQVTHFDPMISIGLATLVDFSGILCCKSRLIIWKYLNLRCLEASPQPENLYSSHSHFCWLQIKDYERAPIKRTKFDVYKGLELTIQITFSFSSCTMGTGTIKYYLHSSRLVDLVYLETSM